MKAAVALIPTQDNVERFQVADATDDLQAQHNATLVLEVEVNVRGFAVIVTKNRHGELGRIELHPAEPLFAPPQTPGLVGPPQQYPLPTDLCRAISGKA